MLILAIDTTGQFSSLSIIKDGNEVLYLKRQSVTVPGKNWRDFPYVLPDLHQKFILNELAKSFRSCGLDWPDIDIIAVSSGSGIFSCVITGLTVAKTWARIYNKPLVKADHIIAHAYSTWLERMPSKFKYPILVFSASGSHSDLSLIKNNNEIQVIFNNTPSETDDNLRYFIGVGKYFFRMANLLLPENEKKDWKNIFKYTAKGNQHKYDLQNYYYKCENICKKTIKQKEKLLLDIINRGFAKADLIDFQYWNVARQLIELVPETKNIPKILKHHKEKLNNILLRKKISQSKLKNLIDNKYIRKPVKNKVINDLLFDFDFSDLLIGLEDLKNKNSGIKGKLSKKLREDLAASFEHSISEIIISKLLALSKLVNAKEIHITGGISANIYFENLLRSKTPLPVKYPKKFQYKLDNAAMIGALAYYQKKYKIKFKGFKPAITK